MDWVFDGGRVSLDFVNTLRDRWADGRELLVSPAALSEWLGLTGLASVPATSDDLSFALILRESIDRVTRAEGDAADVHLLNETAAAVPLPVPQLGHSGRYLLEVPDPVPAAFAALAVDAIELVAADPLIRVCAADDCGVRFLDASPKRNRQWCSMAKCGNRAKARAHYARTKA
ncbi:CGNR zinc finger domain-containing protein [Amycolatopsis sp. cg5]|uniref:CGNR zinc finger domain-containing protein n=1 Tax=Amycolatopsis sp. cg5 TaxID=3238802 RepID=UPI003525A5CE